MTATLSPAGAYAIASQWGSYINDRDPGRVFYTFPLNDPRPQSEDHRADLIAYAEVLVSQRTANAHPDFMQQALQLGELAALIEFFQTSELRP